MEKFDAEKLAIQQAESLVRMSKELEALNNEGAYKPSEYRKMRRDLDKMLKENGLL